jgi:SpoVK/Ycf46/Vps4 family AAA+-type ATPase
VKKSGVLEYYEPDVTINDVGGLDLLKDYVAQRQNAFSDQAREYGLDMPRGVLLVGVPGTGKSLMAKVMTGGRMPLLRCDFGSLMGSLVGESEANQRQMWKLAKAMAPCVLWIDEIEKALGGENNDSGTSKRMLGSLLTEMQEQKEGVYIVATANDVRGLRPELLRRFDDLFFVGLPDEDDRREIVRIHLARRKRKCEDFDTTRIAQATNGYTGAELEKVVIKAMYSAWSAGEEVETHHILAAAPLVVPIAKTMASEIESLTEWAKGRALPAATQRLQTSTHASGIELE